MGTNRRVRRKNRRLVGRTAEAIIAAKVLSRSRSEKSCVAITQRHGKREGDEPACSLRIRILQFPSRNYPGTGSPRWEPVGGETATQRILRKWIFVACRRDSYLQGRLLGLFSAFSANRIIADYVVSHQTFVSPNRGNPRARGVRFSTPGHLHRPGESILDLSNIENINRWDVQETNDSLPPRPHTVVCENDEMMWNDLKIFISNQVRSALNSHNCEPLHIGCDR